MERIRAYFDDLAPFYGQRWTMEEEVRVATRGILARLCGESPLRVVDIGCGPGRFLRNLEPSSAKLRIVVAVDHSFEMIRRARVVAPWARFVQADAARLPFRKGAFDAAILLNAIVNYREIGSILAEAARVASGRLIVDFRNRRHPAVRRNAARVARSPSRFDTPYVARDPEEFRRELLEAGFEIEEAHGVRRPPTDNGEGFRFRHVIGWLASMMPGCAPSYVLRTVRRG